VRKIAPMKTRRAAEKLGHELAQPATVADELVADTQHMESPRSRIPSFFDTQRCRPDKMTMSQ
jgi:hypothetical protein